MTTLTRNDALKLEHLEQGFIVLINKPAHWTSFDVVNKIRRSLKIKKVGHAGTLDPFATGLLIVGVGKGTKQLKHYLNLPKTYHALIRLGVETDTYDVTGKILNEREVTNITKEQVQAVVKEMQGQMWQVPPMFSAKKVRGKPLYKLARQGKEVERKPQKIHIYEAKILNWNPPLVHIELTVSKGTYVRSYAHDLGQKLGVGAMLQELERTSIGQYTLDQSFELMDFLNVWQQSVEQQ